MKGAVRNAVVIFLLAFFTFQGAAVAGQRLVKVRLVILDEVTGEPVIGAPVRIEGQQQVVVADEKGAIELELPPGVYNFVVIDPDHESFQAKIDTTDGVPVNLTLALKQRGHAEAEEEIVIRASRPKRQVSEYTVEMEQVKKIPGTQGDVVRIVQSMPGVARSLAVGGSGGVGLVVRGAAPEDSRVLIDGHEIPLLYHFGGLKSVLNSDMLERIDFMPGGFGPEYGEAIGGIVEVETRAPRTRELDGYVETSLLDMGFFLEGPLGREDVGFIAAARRSTVDLWLPHVIPSDLGMEFTVAPVYYDYQAKVDWSVNATSHLSLLAFGSHDEMKFLLSKPPSGDPSLRGEMSMWVDFHRLFIDWKCVPPEGWQLSASIAGGWDRAKLQVGDDRHMYIAVPNFEGKLDWQWDVASSLTFRAGFEAGGAHFDASLAMPRPPKEGELPSRFATQKLLVGTETIMSGGVMAYATADVKPTNSTTWSAGLRWEWYGPPLWQLAVMPRFSVRHSPRKGTTVKASVGLYQQMPQHDELSKVLGNPKLLLERAWHFTMGLEQELPLRLKGEITAFFKTLDRLVVPDDVMMYSNRGVGKISGIEVLFKREMSDNFFGWLAYTFMRSRRRDGPDQPWRLFSFDQTHILTLVAGLRLPKGPPVPSHHQRDGWEFGLRFQLVSGNPYTPVAGSVFDADYDVYQRIPGEPNSRRLPLFHQLDLRVDYTWAFESWALSVFLDVQNVYNHRAAEAVRYNYDASQQAYVEGLPVLPYLGIKGSF